MLCLSRKVGSGPGLCGLKNLPEFTQELRACEPRFRYTALAAGRKVEHPERHFQNPASLDLFQAAVRYFPSPFDKAGMHPHCPPVPWMPGIADFTDISNMGVVLLSCITRSARTKARATSCCFQSRTSRQFKL